jgi:adenylate cyclase
MAIEIERKFLVDHEKIKPVLEAAEQTKRLRQYYLIATKELAVRIRMEGEYGDEILAIKSGTDPMQMNELEFKLPEGAYYDRIDERVGTEIDKIRHLVEFDGRTWEVDEFDGELDGLIVAEIECDDAAEITNLPDWVTEEVTFDSRYKNAVLCIEGLPS